MCTFVMIACWLVFVALKYQERKPPTWRSSEIKSQLYEPFTNCNCTWSNARFNFSQTDIIVKISFARWLANRCPCMIYRGVGVLTSWKRTRTRWLRIHYTPSIVHFQNFLRRALLLVILRWNKEWHWKGDAGTRSLQFISRRALLPCTADI